MSKKKIRPPQGLQATVNGQTVYLNDLTAMKYYDILLNLCLSRFEWKNAPNRIDVRFLEMALLTDGNAVLFKDEILNEYLGLRVLQAGQFDVYGYPLRSTGMGYNNVQYPDLTQENSVLCYNNMGRTSTLSLIVEFANEMALLDKIKSVNVKAQRTPVLILADKTQQLAMENVYAKYDGDVPVIFGRKGGFDETDIKAISTGAPYIADKLQQQKVDTWNEVLTFLGISNVSNQKKERMITDEVNRLQGGTMITRSSYLQSRQEACEKFNNMYGTNMWVEFIDDTQAGNDEQKESGVLENE